MGEESASLPRRGLILAVVGVGGIDLSVILHLSESRKCDFGGNLGGFAEKYTHLKK